MYFWKIKAIELGAINHWGSIRIKLLRYFFAEEDEGDHCGKCHESVEKVAEAHRHAEWHDGKDDEGGYESPDVMAAMAFAEYVGCAAGAIETVAEHWWKGKAYHYDHEEIFAVGYGIAKWLHGEG